MIGAEKEYATALFSIAVEEGKTSEFFAALKTVRAVIGENPEYTEYLSSPAVALSERLQSVDEAFGGMEESVVSFIKLLCENGRAKLILKCIDEFEALVMEASSVTVAKVSSAIELSEKQRTALCEKLVALTGKTVTAEYSVDPSLIGGVKIEIEGKVYDGSLKNRLRDVKDVILG